MLGNRHQAFAVLEIVDKPLEAPHEVLAAGLEVRARTRGLVVGQLLGDRALTSWRV